VLRQCTEGCGYLVVTSPLDVSLETHSSIGRMGRSEMLWMTMGEEGVVSKTDLIAHMLGGGAGFELQHFRDMVEGFTPSLEAAVLKSMTALKLLMGDLDAFRIQNTPKSKMMRHLVSRLPTRKRQKKFREEMLGHLSQGTGGATDANNRALAPAEPFFVRLVDDAFVDCTYGSETRDLRTMNRVGFAFNRKYAELFGISAEEIFSRVCNGEFDVANATHDFEALNCLLESLMKMGGAFSDGRITVLTKFAHWQPNSPIKKEGVITAWYSYAEIESNLMHVHHWVQAMNPAEYDKLRAEMPHICRPGFRAAGDDRCGRELVHQHDEWRRVTLKDLSSSLKGQKMLERYAGDVSNRVQELLDRTLLVTASKPLDRAAQDLTTAQPEDMAEQSNTPLAAELRSDKMDEGARCEAEDLTAVCQDYDSRLPFMTESMIGYIEDASPYTIASPSEESSTPFSPTEETCSSSTPIGLPESSPFSPPPDELSPSPFPFARPAIAEEDCVEYDFGAEAGTELGAGIREEDIFTMLHCDLPCSDEWNEAFSFVHQPSLQSPIPPSSESGLRT